MRDRGRARATAPAARRRTPPAARAARRCRIATPPRTTRAPTASTGSRASSGPMRVCTLATMPGRRERQRAAQQREQSVGRRHAALVRARRTPTRQQATAVAICASCTPTREHHQQHELRSCPSCPSRPSCPPAHPARQSRAQRSTARTEIRFPPPARSAAIAAAIGRARRSSRTSRRRCRAAPRRAARRSSPRRTTGSPRRHTSARRAGARAPGAARARRSSRRPGSALRARAVARQQHAEAEIDRPRSASRPMPCRGSIGRSGPRRDRGRARTTAPKPIAARARFDPRNAALSRAMRASGVGVMRPTLRAPRSDSRQSAAPGRSPPASARRRRAAARAVTFRA